MAATNRPRILVAGTIDAMNAVRDALQHDDAEIVEAYSVREALDCCARMRFDVVACSVRFDESRMFEFLQALMEKRPPCEARIVCFRSSGSPLKASTRRAICQALEALGVARFADLAEIAERYGDAAAGETLRKLVLVEHFVPPAPPNGAGSDIY